MLWIILGLIAWIVSGIISIGLWIGLHSYKGATKPLCQLYTRRYYYSSYTIDNRMEWFMLGLFFVMGPMSLAGDCMSFGLDGDLRTAIKNWTLIPGGTDKQKLLWLLERQD